MKYKNIFFDLDDTLWAFSENAKETFEEMYNKYSFHKYFNSFDHFYSLYQGRNKVLWEEYSKARIKKEELNKERFSYPLEAVGVHDLKLVEEYSGDFLSTIPKKEKLMPYAKELLEHLKGKYNLYILSNGFRELQAKKMQASGIYGYFKRIILSEDIGVLKPNTQIFHFALSATQSELAESVMIGDNWEADIVGAANVGMDQVYYNFKNLETSFKPTYMVNDLSEITSLL